MIFRIVYNGIDLMGSDLDSCVLNPSLEQELNTAGSLTFTMPPTHPMWGAMKVFVGDIEVYENGELIFFGRIVNIDQNWNNERIIECEGALAFFNDTYIDGHVRWDEEGTTVGSFFTDIVNRHNALVPDNRKIFVGNIDQSFMNYLVTREVEWEKTLDVISQMCIDTNGGWLMLRKDLEEDKIYIDWVKDITSGIDQPVQFGLNLLDVTKSYHGEDICTAVIPRGEQNDEGVYLDISEMPTVSDVGQVDHTYGSNILYHHEGVENHGAVLQVHDFSSCATKEDLYEEARVWLIKKNTDVATIEVEAAELGYFGDGYPIFKVGKLVEVIDGIHFPDESTVTYPMYKISMNLDSGKKQITIGTPPKKELTQIYASDVDSTGNGGVKSGTSSGGGSGGSGSGDGVTDVIVNGSSVVNNHVASFSAVSTNQMNTAINNATSGLASTGYVDNAVAPKANTSDVNTALALKANISDVNQALSTKANTSDVTSALALKADKTEIIDVVANPSETATDDLNTIKIGNTVYDIPGGGGSGGSGQDYTCDVLFVNDPLPSPTSGTANVTRTYTLNKSIDDYDAVYVVIYNYYISGQGATNITSRIVFKNDYYLKGFDNYSYYDGLTDPDRTRRINFTFTDSTHIQTISFRSEYNNEPILYRVYGLRFKSSVDIFNPQIYSEEERVVGVWIDGKPLYQKVVDCGYGPNSSTKEINLTSLNIDNCIQIGGYMCHNNTYFLPIPRVSDRYIADQLAFGYNNSTKLLGITCRDRDMTNMRIMAILKYTKTTDTSGSSHWLSGGVMAVNYTEDEQIIGQYLGKTLYQRTWDLGSSVTFSSIDWQNTGINIPNGESIISGEVSDTNQSSNKPNLLRYSQFYLNNNYVYLTFGNDGVTHKVRYITLRYTKTTDTAGNPMANILATQKELEEIAYHYRDHCYTTLSDYYSTDERVVGRWTDGKPLYQKTFTKVFGSSNNQETITTFTNGEDLHYATGYIETLNSNTRTIIPYNNSSNYCLIRQLNNDLVSIRDSAGSWYGYTYKVTIQYTKSTDTAGTGPTPGNLIYLPALYSEEEREIGVWTDGKPLYQKTWDFSSSPIAINGGNQWQTLSGVSTVGMSEIIKAECVDYHGTSFNLYVALDGDNYTHAVVNSQTNITMYLMRLTLTYTKTTDTAGSGRYLPDGQLAHHYSTSEKVVGTWIDGSTIYERTWDFGTSGEMEFGPDTWVSTTIPRSNINRIVKVNAIANSGVNWDFIAANCDTGSYVQLYHSRPGNKNIKVRYLTLRYTKSS